MLYRLYRPEAPGNTASNRTETCRPAPSTSPPLLHPPRPFARSSMNDEREDPKLNPCQAFAGVCRSPWAQARAASWVSLMSSDHEGSRASMVLGLGVRVLWF